MEYYEYKLGWQYRIDSRIFYNRKRRKNAHVTAVLGWKNGEKAIIAYILKYYN